MTAMPAADRYDELQRRTFAASTKATADSLDRRMSGDAIVRFLAAKRYAAVATTRRDGRPHLAMTGSFADPITGHVWLPAMAGTVRVSNVRAQPYASVVVSEGEGDEHTMVTLEGPATTVEVPPADVLERWVAHVGSAPDWATAWIRVDVERLLSYAGVASPYGTATTSPD